jgi:hypothetical protein
MKSIMLTLLDEDNQLLTDVPLEDYAVPSPEDEIDEDSISDMLSVCPAIRNEDLCHRCFSSIWNCVETANH